MFFSIIILSLTLTTLRVGGDFSFQSENSNVQKLFSKSSLYDTFQDGKQHLPNYNDEGDKKNKSIPNGGKEKFKKLPLVSEFKLLNDTLDYALVTWTHYDSKVLYILTCSKMRRNMNGRSLCLGKSNAYRSTDHGATFENESHKFKNSSQISSIYTSSTDRKVIQINDYQNRVIYSSINEGESFHVSHVPFSPASTMFHPTLANYIVTQDAQRNIFITNDTGINWYFLCSNVNSFFWTNKESSNSQMIMEVKLKNGGKIGKGNYSVIFAAEFPYIGHVKMLSDDLGPIDPHSLMVQDDYLFIWRMTSAGTARLFSSFKRAPFKECQFPSSDLLQKFHIMEPIEGEIILAALNSSGLTSLYISDRTGTKFSIAFKYIKANWNNGPKPVIDLHQVSGLPGTLLANHVNKGTFISYNKGGSWSPLRPPGYNMQGKSTNCMLPDCKLRLSLYIRDSYAVGWSPVTSSVSAPGIIIAQGWLQYKPSQEAVQLSCYASNDGGQTWKQILKGRQVVKLLDHGGIITTIPLVNAFSYPEINNLDYSCDGGSSWMKVVLSSQLKRLVGIAAHPAAKASLLTVFAAELSATKTFTWIVWRVNFTSIFDYKCQPDNYTLWTASSDITTEGCILGQKYIYTRRKNDVCCYNGLGFTPLANISTCECTVNDFDCDFGFKRDRFGSLCTPTSFANLYPPVNCPEGSSYFKSKGYIKVIGDRCQGGIIDEIMPVQLTCPARAPDGLSLIVKKYSIALGKHAIIILNQKSGFLGTNYTWDFGDGVRRYNLSFEEARIQNHTYENLGTYIIELIAFNKAGSYTAKTVLRVIKRVSEIFLHATQPVVANEQAVYTVTVEKTRDNNVEQQHGFVHFAWIFEPIKTPVLSLNSSVTHTYAVPGTYEVEVQVFNAISVVSTTKTVTVYGDVRVVELQFSSTLDLLNTGKQQWNEKFKSFIHNYLTTTFDIREDMLEVQVSKSLPTIVTLSLVQNKITQTKKIEKAGGTSGRPPRKSIDDVLHEIIGRVRSRKIVFFLYGREIRVLSATVTRDKKVAKRKVSQEQKTPAYMKLYLYIGVPAGILVLLVMGLVGRWVYKRKQRSTKPNTYLQMQDEHDQSRLQQFSLENFEST
eukprot:gene5685-6386_t